MKNTIIYFVLILFICCKTQGDLPSVDVPKYTDTKTVSGEIIKIDSVKNNALIYLESETLNYKIVSSQLNYDNCELLKVGQVANFEIKQLTFPPARKRSNKNNLEVANYLHIERCTFLKDNSKVCTESTMEVYLRIDEKGLCK